MSTAKRKPKTVRFFVRLSKLRACSYTTNITHLYKNCRKSKTTNNSGCMCSKRLRSFGALKPGDYSVTVRLAYPGEKPTVSVDSSMSTTRGGRWAPLPDAVTSILETLCVKRRNDLIVKLKLIRAREGII